MKLCTKCNQEKSLDNFRKRTKSPDGLANWCTPCFATYERERYQNGDRVRKDRNKANTIKKRQDYIWKILVESNCKVCGEDDPLVLEFDHRNPETKEYNVTEMYHLSEAKIAKEVDKCDILCANCHRRRTIQQFGFWRGTYLTVAETD